MAARIDGDLVLSVRVKFSRFLAAVLVFLLALPGTVPAFAQDAAATVQEPLSQQVFEKFNSNAQLAASALRDTGAEETNERQAHLEELRQMMAKDRDLARQMADRGSLQTRLLQAQLAALGTPEDGAAEPSAITQQRDDLDKRLSVYLAPVIGARAAEVRAATLVDELDAQIRKIEHNRVWQRGYSIVDPRFWIEGVGAWGQLLNELRLSAFTGVPDSSSPAMRIALAIGLLVIGPFLLAQRVRVWLIGFLQRRFMRSETMAGKLLIALAEDLLAALILFIAIVLGFSALGLVLSIVFPTEQVVSFTLTTFLLALIVAVGVWIGHSTLRSPFPELRLVQLSSEQARRGVRIVRNIAILMAIETYFAVAETSGWISSDASGLVSSLVVVTGAFMTWRLAEVIRSSKDYQETVSEVEPQDPGSEVAKIDYAGPFARLLKLIVIVALVAVVAGYPNLAREIYASMVASLGVIATAVFLHRSIKLVLNLLANGRLKTYSRILRLIPIITGFLILLATIPLLAVVWGYRSQEIGDAIIALRTGVSFGEITLSIGDVATFAGVFLVGWIITRWVQRILKVSILPQTGLDKGAQAALVTGFGYVGIILAAFVAIGSTGLDLSSLAFVAGALSVGLGFGLQKVVENFTSGILLLIERPIREGDWVEVGNFSGIVKKVSVRSTHIETFDRHRIIIPNSEFIIGSVKNLSFSGGPTRIIVTVGVAYGSDLDQVRNVILQCAEANENVLHYPEPAVAMEGFGESSIDVKLLCFVANVTDGAPTASDLKFAIASRFAAEGIEIPFPQRELHIVDGTASKSFTGSAGEAGRGDATQPGKADVRAGSADGDTTSAG